MARFVLGGRSKVRKLSALPAVPAAPTQVELTAGVNWVGTVVAEELFDIQGWAVEPTSYPTPGFASLEVGNVPGPQNYPDSSMAWYKDTVSETIYTSAAQGVVGYAAIMLDGQLAGAEAEIFGFTVSSRVRDKALDAAHAFRANTAINAPVYAEQAA